MNDLARELRAAAASLLPEGAFLRRDRGDALFVTDAPRRGTVPDGAAMGFICDMKDGLARLTPGPEWLERLEARHPDPPDPLCASLRRFHGPPDRDTLRLFAAGAKLLDGAPNDPTYARRVRQAAAVALREHRGGGGLYACGLILHFIEKEINI